MVNAEQIARRAEKIYKGKRDKIHRLLRTNDDLDVLKLIRILGVDLDSARLFRTSLAKHADLCDLASRRSLNDDERAKLALTYAILYQHIGDKGIVELSAAWLHTRPKRQARGS